MIQTYKVPDTEDRKYRRIGFIILVVLVLIVGVWGATAPLSSAIPVTGKLSVASNNRVIQHLEGGIVKSIQVRDGDHVKKNQILIELDATRADAELQISISQFAEALAAEARLIAERDNKPSVLFTQKLLEICQDFECTSLKQSQINEFNARRSFLESEKEILFQQIEQAQNQINGLHEIIAANKLLSESYAQEIKEWKILFEQQLTDKLHLREIERQKIKTDGEIASSNSEIARLQGQISQFKTQIITQRQSFIKEVTERLSQVQTKVSDLRSRIAALRDMRERTTIVSPVEGIITNLQLHTIGGVISSAKPILEIVPFGEQLIIDGNIVATEISNIHLGLRAEIRFPGFAHIKSLGIVEGEVIHIAPDAIKNETTGVLYYQVKIAVMQKGQQELSRNNLILQPGIPADVMIISGTRTMFDYLIHPLKMMFVKSFNEK